MKILTIGAGFIADHLPYDKISTKIPLDWSFINTLVSYHKPDVLINCVGKTGRPNVDWCESHREETAAANVALPILLAEACVKHNVRLVQLGSGCVYFGESSNCHYLQGDDSPMPDITIKPLGDPDYQLFWAKSFTIQYPTKRIDDGWRETDFANPQSYYSKTKYACDLALGEMPHVATLRIRMPVSSLCHPRNLINKLRGYPQVIDIANSMTFMDDLVNCIDWVARKGISGVFHATNPQPLTAAQIMREYQKYVPEHKFEIMSEAQLDKLTLAKRSNCILDSSKLEYAGFSMTDSEEALHRCMKLYTDNTYNGGMYVE